MRTIRQLLSASCTAAILAGCAAIQLTGCRTSQTQRCNRSVQGRHLQQGADGCAARKLDQ